MNGPLKFKAYGHTNGDYRLFHNITLDGLFMPHDIDTGLPICDHDLFMFTGTVDANGKEIYVGDKIREKANGNLWTIAWDKTHIVLKTKSGDVFMTLTETAPLSELVKS